MFWELPVSMSKTLEKVGEVSHYFTRISVAVVELSAPVNVGDRITIKGMTTNFEQTVESMQIEHKTVDAAGKGDSIGLKVNERTREGDIVYKIIG
jgi:translation elongation factor EF-1alpha